jgi:anti-anti-sigma factor
MRLSPPLFGPAQREGGCAKHAKRQLRVSNSDMTVAEFSGEIDFTARETFRSALNSLLEVPVAIVDLSGVSYMDSSALAEILFLHRARLRAGRSAPRIVVGPKVSRLFDVAGLRSVVPAFATVDDAKSGL